MKFLRQKIAKVSDLCGETQISTHSNMLYKSNFKFIPFISEEQKDIVATDERSEVSWVTYMERVSEMQSLS